MRIQRIVDGVLLDTGRCGRAEYLSFEATEAAWELIRNQPHAGGSYTITVEWKPGPETE